MSLYEEMAALVAALDLWPDTHTGGSGGTSVHGDLTGRTAADQHPIGAITGLQAALDGGGGGGGGLSQPMGSTGGDGVYYGLPGWVAASTGGATAALTQYDIYTMPFFVPRAITVTGWDAYVNGGHTASTVLRAAIYNASGEDAWAAGGLHTDLGTVSTATAAGKTVTGLSVSLAAGFYQLAFVTNAAALTLYGARMGHLAMRTRASLGTNAYSKNVWQWLDYGASPDIANTGAPSTLAGSGDSAAALSTPSIPPTVPITLAWTV